MNGAAPSKGGLELNPSYPTDAYFMMLVRKLAQRHSQQEIADILNERELLRNDGQPWQQFSISRYMAAHGIKPGKEWRGWDSTQSPRSMAAHNENNKGVSDELNSSANY